ncbi:MAG: sensor histidine kinase [Bacillota bacterium]
MAAETVLTLQDTSEIINVEDYRKAMLNILEDFAEEKRRLEETQRAILNILEDFAGEKNRLEETQRAMLNLLDDFGMEREKTEAVNRELREAEDQIINSLREKEALLKEIHHRVKNNLQIIHSMLNLQLSYIKDAQAIEMFKESKDRVYSMALIHEKLYQSESLINIDLGEYIPSLLANLLFSYGTTKRAIKPQIKVEKITLGVDTVIPCALIINELISNSLKHAFPDSLGYADGKGEIRVELSRDTGNKFKLTVSDNGVGLPQGFEMQKCKSLGLKLVSVLVQQLKGSIQINTDGRTEFVITFKASK